MKTEIDNTVTQLQARKHQGHHQKLEKARKESLTGFRGSIALRMQPVSDSYAPELYGNTDVLF